MQVAEAESSCMGYHHPAFSSCPLTSSFTRLLPPATSQAGPYGWTAKLWETPQSRDTRGEKGAATGRGEIVETETFNIQELRRKSTGMKSHQSLQEKHAVERPQLSNAEDQPLPGGCRACPVPICWQLPSSSRALLGLLHSIAPKFYPSALCIAQ